MSPDRWMDEEDMRCMIHTHSHTYTHIHRVDYYSAVKRNETMLLAATQMDLEIIKPNEINQKDQTTWYHLHVESKIQHKWMYLWSKTDTDIENRIMLANMEEGAWVKDWEFEIIKCKLLYTGQINNKVLLYSTGNYIQYPVTNHNSK